MAATFGNGTSITFGNVTWETGVLSAMKEQREVNVKKMFYVKHIYADPVKKTTVVVWADGSKTKVKCSEEDEYSLEAGFWAALAKKVYGSYEDYSRFFAKKKVTITSKFDL